MSRLIYYFPLIFLFVSLILILLIKPRKYHYWEEEYLSTLPFRLVIAAYATTIFALVEFFRDAPVTFAALTAFSVPPLLLLSGAGTAIAFRTCRFRKTSLLLAGIYLLIPCLMRLFSGGILILP